MSRIKELKKQYPELNISIIDLFAKLDESKTYKYLPLICKIFGKKFDLKDTFKDSNEFESQKLYYQANLINVGISTVNLTDNELFMMNYLTEMFSTEEFFTLKQFIYYMEKGHIENKDVTSYSSINELRGAVTLATMKEWNKDMENQVIKEYEDEKWICVRPLTFAASAKYGSGTRWCTTYQKEKQYFEKYWRQGVLVYFINKKTGYKFAMFKSLFERDLSFWNAEDTRVDFLTLDIDEFLYPIIKNISKSDKSNKNLSSEEIQEQVHQECIPFHDKDVIALDEPPTVIEFTRNETAIPVYHTPPTMTA